LKSPHLAQEAGHVNQASTTGAALGRHIALKRILIILGGFATVKAPLTAGDRIHRTTADIEHLRDSSLRQFTDFEQVMNLSDKG
jgi:hypothetical protein